MNKLLQLWFALFVAVAPSAWAEEFDSGGVKIHYLAEGREEPVILIHGLSAILAKPKEFTHSSIHHPDLHILPW
jgi:hypothetical protein